jgi:hypothetical protein
LSAGEFHNTIVVASAAHSVHMLQTPPPAKLVRQYSVNRPNTERSSTEDGRTFFSKNIFDICIIKHITNIMYIIALTWIFKELILVVNKKKKKKKKIFIRDHTIMYDFQLWEITTPWTEPDLFVLHYFMRKSRMTICDAVSFYYNVYGRWVMYYIIVTNRLVSGR